MPDFVRYQQSGPSLRVNWNQPPAEVSMIVPGCGQYQLSCGNAAAGGSLELSAHWPLRCRQTDAEALANWPSIVTVCRYAWHGWPISSSQLPSWTGLPNADPCSEREIALAAISPPPASG